MEEIVSRKFGILFRKETATLNVLWKKCEKKTTEKGLCEYDQPLWLFGHCDPKKLIIKHVEIESNMRRNIHKRTLVKGYRHFGMLHIIESK